MLCIFFLTYAVVSFFEVPSLVVGLFHYRHPVSVEAESAYYAYWTRRYAFWIAAAFVRGAAALWLAGVTYRGGARFRSFLLDTSAEETQPAATA